MTETSRHGGTQQGAPALTDLSIVARVDEASEKSLHRYAEPPSDGVTDTGTSTSTTSTLNLNQDNR
jgi:hypothetical protein